jgi:hypothetical protein
MGKANNETRTRDRKVTLGKADTVTRTWDRKVVLAKKAGLGDLDSLRVPRLVEGLMWWSPTKDWPIRCVGNTVVKGKKMFIFVGKSWQKRQVESTIRLTRTEALQVIKRAVAARKARDAVRGLA